MGDHYRTDKTLFRYSHIIGELLGQWVDERNAGSRSAGSLDHFLADIKNRQVLPDGAAETLRRRILTFEAARPAATT